MTKLAGHVIILMSILVMSIWLTTQMHALPFGFESVQVMKLPITFVFIVQCAPYGVMDLEFTMVTGLASELTTSECDFYKGLFFFREGHFFVSFFSKFICFVAWVRVGLKQSNVFESDEIEQFLRTGDNQVCVDSRCVVF